MLKTVLFNQFSLAEYSFFVYTQLNVKTVIFQTIQFSIGTQFSSIWPRERTLPGTTNLGQSGPRGDGNKGVLHIPQRSSITGASTSDHLVSYPGHSMGESYSSTADWARE